MKRAISSAAVLTLIASALAGAQGRPDFNGVWLMDMTRSGSAAQRADVAPTAPVKLIVEQTPSHVTIETHRDGERQLLRFTFGESGGSPQPVGTSGSDELSVEPLDVQWRGEELVTVVVYRLNGVPVKQTQTRRLAEGGREMVVETRLAMQHGYQTNHPEYRSDAVVSDVFSKQQ